ncbi:hypothetical protein H7K43_15425 [Streptomyces sp. TYQ1024]|uniref:hypothetical protein n=1 Tax=Streptomyces sp. TYQ1024 TaxID=2762559 RepID=UPI00163BC92F|nr:hypothetical protein [Streptomyces sp. TYQ1024]MBC2876429.1 hypothetical protein [Streptomyces sp. TYQ1024]UKW27589.1 hypothetical protein MCU78_00010 [Streptomyces sp. TYQ1024]
MEPSLLMARRRASYDGKLFCVVRGDGSRWSSFQQLPSGYIPVAPALAPYNGTLYCVMRVSGGHELYWATFGGFAWSEFTMVNGVASLETPALASNNAYLLCVCCG